MSKTRLPLLSHQKGPGGHASEGSRWPGHRTPGHEGTGGDLERLNIIPG